MYVLILTCHQVIKNKPVTKAWISNSLSYLTIVWFFNYFFLLLSLCFIKCFVYSVFVLRSSMSVFVNWQKVFFFKFLATFFTCYFPFSIWSMLFTYFGGWDKINENMHKSTVFEWISIYLHDLHLFCGFMYFHWQYVFGGCRGKQDGFLRCNHYHTS